MLPNYNEYRVRAKAMTTEQIKNNLFILNMKDHWNNNDWTYSWVLKAELQERNN